jgi:hypothetical protein
MNVVEGLALDTPQGVNGHNGGSHTNRLGRRRGRRSSRRRRSTSHGNGKKARKRKGGK